MELFILGLIVLGLIGDESEKSCESSSAPDESNDDSPALDESSNDDCGSGCMHGYNTIDCSICGPPEKFS